MRCDLHSCTPSATTVAHLLSTRAVWAQGYRKGSPALLNRHQPEDGWVGRVPGEGPCTDRAGETSEDTTLASQSQDGLLLLSCFSCVRLCNPIDGSLPGSAIPGILQARTLEWVAISFSNA